MSLRLIAGSAKGRRLRCPPSEAVRPASVRLRQSLFSMIEPELEGAEVLDLFAGAGTLGIEALSRGAAQVVFVEKHPACVKALKANLEELGFGGQGKVMASDALRALRDLGAAGKGFAVVFVDPPYEMTDDRRASAMIYSALEEAAESGLIREGALVVVRKRKAAPQPEGLGRLELERTRDYSHAELLFLRARRAS